jgi:hypothetical protein
MFCRTFLEDILRQTFQTLSGCTVRMLLCLELSWRSSTYTKKPPVTMSCFLSASPYQIPPCYKGRKDLQIQSSWHSCTRLTALLVAFKLFVALQPLAATFTELLCSNCLSTATLEWIHSLLHGCIAAKCCYAMTSIYRRRVGISLVI